MLKRRVSEQFARLVAKGYSPNEAAAEALRLAKQAEAPPAPASEAASRYGPLCRALVGPFQSICVVGTPRREKKLLVLDIDHTIYDPLGVRGPEGQHGEAGRGHDEPLPAALA